MASVRVRTLTSRPDLDGCLVSLADSLPKDRASAAGRVAVVTAGGELLSLRPESLEPDGQRVVLPDRTLLTSIIGASGKAAVFQKDGHRRTVALEPIAEGELVLAEHVFAAERPRLFLGLLEDDVLRAQLHPRGGKEEDVDEKLWHNGTLVHYSNTERDHCIGMDVSMINHSRTAPNCALCTLRLEGVPFHIQTLTATRHVSRFEELTVDFGPSFYNKRDGMLREGTEGVFLYGTDKDELAYYKDVLCAEERVLGNPALHKALADYLTQSMGLARDIVLAQASLLSGAHTQVEGVEEGQFSVHVAPDPKRGARIAVACLEAAVRFTQGRCKLVGSLMEIHRSGGRKKVGDGDLPPGILSLMEKEEYSELVRQAEIVLKK